MRFDNKVAIITGGASGIGRATSAVLSKEGCRVYVLDIKPVGDKGGNINFMECNVRSYAAVKKSVDAAFEREGKIDLLFANAGVHFVGDIENTTIEQFENVLSINVKGVFYTLKAVLPIMRKQKRGNIVIMGSDQSFIGKGKSSVYGLTKGALGQLTKSTAIDYAEHNIRVNCICPGTIDTPLYHDAVANFSKTFDVPKEKIYEIVNTAQPIKRVGTPEEIANAALFLLSDDCGFMTGSLISVDGGYTCQ